MAWFEEGDIVYFTSRSRYRGAIGIIKGVSCIGSDYIDFYVLIEDDEDKKENYQVVEDDEIRYVYHIEIDEEERLDQPAFQTGDVVDTPDGIQVVREVVFVDNEESAKYMYEVSHLDSDDTVCRYEESSLEYQYHDIMWEEYFTESTRNNLPEWRGELHNSTIFDYNHYYGDPLLAYYNNYYSDNPTLPFVVMEYIIEEYTISNRIEAVLAHKKNAIEIGKILGIKPEELYNIRRSIITKTDNRNTREIDMNFKKRINNKRKFQFTDLELSVASEIDKRDVVFGKYRNHFPLDMTNTQIMESIREAYNSAHKIGKRKIRRSYVMRHLLYSKVEPDKGIILYEGYSPKYDLTIQFQYNFDLDVIETAYPVISDNIVKK